VATTLLWHGSVYATADPFATAIVIDGTDVAWVGQDGAAEAAMASVDEVIDLDGRLVTPAFVDAWHAPAGASASPTGPGDVASPDLDPASQGVVARCLAHEVREGAGGDVSDAARSWSAQIQRRLRATEPGRATCVRAAAGGAYVLDASLPAVAAMLHESSGVLQPAGGRLVVAAPDPQPLTEQDAGVLSGHGVVVVHSADKALVDGFLPVLVAAGVGLALGSGSTQLSPWRLVQGVSGGRADAHITTRAAFNAATRGGWRALGARQPGVLAAGAPATLAVWRTVGDLVVTTPDDRVAAWSTDPRAGVPGLPDLAGAEVPTCEASMDRGQWRYRREAS
jgi:imidazolonepropionase-like amidohydrolase